MDESGSKFYATSKTRTGKHHMTPIMEIKIEQETQLDAVYECLIPVLGRTRSRSYCINTAKTKALNRVRSDSNLIPETIQAF